MILSSNLLILAAVLACVAGVAGVLAGRRVLTCLDSGTRPQWFLAAAGFAILFEYFALGPVSFVYMDDEGQITNPIYNYIFTRAVPGQQFVHEFAGGNDLYSMFLTGMQTFSFEYLFFSLFPHWLAVGLQKALTFAVGVIGAFLLARRAGGAGPAMGAVLAVYYFLSDPFILNGGLAAGTGWVAPPIALYLVVWRTSQPHYLAGVLIAAVFIVNASPTNVFSISAFTIVAGTVLLGRTAWKDIGRIAFALILIVVLLALNWRENLVAMYQMAPFTSRGALQIPDPVAAMLQLARSFTALDLNHLPQLLFVATLAALLVLRDRMGLRALGAFVLFIGLYAVIQFFPWQVVDLGVVRRVSWNHSVAAFGTLAIPMAARVLDRLDTAWAARTVGRNPFRAGMFAVALVCALFIWRKGENLYFFLHMAGQSQFTTISNLARPDWAPQQPFRVVTMRNWAPEPNIVPGFYGLDSFDGELSLIPRNVTEFWETMIRRVPAGAGALYPTFGVDYGFWSWQTRQYNLADQLSFAHLAMANVGYIIVPLPLKPGTLERVSGPSPRVSVQKSVADRMAYYRVRAEKIFNFGEVSIYRIAEPLPRAFAARGIRWVADSARREEWLSEVRTYGPSGFVVGLASELEKIGVNSPSPGFTIRSHGPGVNRYDVAIDAPRGGVLVVNIPYLPFWRAEVDGVAVPIASVNIIHMAVAVPSGARRVTFRYRRPRLVDLLSNQNLNR